MARRYGAGGVSGDSSEASPTSSRRTARGARDLATLRTRVVIGYCGLPSLYGPAIASRYCDGVFDPEMRSWLPATNTS